MACDLGCPGSVAPRGANFALQNCDFLLIIGARMDFAITGYAPEKLARGACKAMVDIDAAELAKLSPHIQMPVCADAGVFMSSMLERDVERKDRSDADGALPRLECALSGRHRGTSQAGAGQRLSLGRSDREREESL